jgi:hypothetical protein
MSAINNISLFIPHIYDNYTTSMVSDIFNKMNIGDVKNVDFVRKMGSDGKPYNAAYIHFHEWYDNSVSRNLQERVLDTKKEARVMYDHPWYWIVLENKGKKHVPGDRKPRIVIDAFNTPKKDIAPSLSQDHNNRAEIDFVIHAPKKTKTYSQMVVQPLTPVNLVNAFNSQVAHEITQEEMDEEMMDEEMMDEEMMDEEMMVEEMMDEEMMDEIEYQMNMDNMNLATFDARYVKTIEEENAWLRCQLAHVHNLYNTELIKNQAP